MKILVPLLMVGMLAVIFVEGTFGWGKMTGPKWLILSLLGGLTSALLLWAASKLPDRR